MENLLEYIKQAGGTAADIFGVINPPATKQTPAAATPAPTNWAKYLPWILGGAALLVIGGLFLRRG